MKRILWLFILLFECNQVFCILHADNQMVLANFETLYETKQSIQSKDDDALKDYLSIIEKADTHLKAGFYSVTHKKLIPPSGDKHDYMTFAPYFWPNPDTPDGKPYIRKDGEVNPETRNNDTDYQEKSICFEAIDILGKAYFFSDNEVYGRKAIYLIKKWFLDEETKMNPHLNYGQGIPGVNDGRPFGIIEFGSIRNVMMCLEILEHKNLLDKQVKNGMNEWLSAYANWLQNSEIGKMEKTRTNNHGTWYDVQLSSILLYLGKTDQLKAILEQSKDRIAGQIEPDGSQPHELGRTKSFSYSTMNLEAFMKLAEIGSKVDVDLWNFETPDGRSIKKAFEFLMQFITTDKEWQYQQLGSLKKQKERLKRLLLRAGKTFNEPTYLEIGNNQN